MRQKSWRCRECSAITPESKLLVAAHPFIEKENVSGCPNCGALDEYLREVCDEPRCKDEANCGTPVTNGYRRTCYKHMPCN